MAAETEADDELAVLSAHIHAWLQRETALVAAPSPLLVVSVCLIVGFLASRLAQRCRLPAVTGQILAGVCIGHYVLFIFPETTFHGLAPITDFALGFIGLTIGSHLDVHRLHNAGRRIAWMALADAVLTPVIVFFCLVHFAHVGFEIALLLAGIAITTAPETIIHVVKEERAAGMFTKTLLAVVAVNSVLTIIGFYTLYYYVEPVAMGGFAEVRHPLLRAMELTVASALVGGSVGGVVIYVTEKVRTHLSLLTIDFVAVVITVGLAATLHLSGVLACLAMGIVMTNFARRQEELFRALHHIEAAVFCLLFVLAGTHVDVAAVKAASAVGAVLIAARTLSKAVAPTIGALAAGATARVRRSMAVSLIPTGGISIGLMVLCENRLPFVEQARPSLEAVVLTLVVFSEMLGPLLTRAGLRWAGEAQKDRLRLMDFLEEEYVLTDLRAGDKWEALAKLAAFMHRTHKCREISVAELERSVVEREKLVSTGIGDGLAIPHAIIAGGPKIRGVIGVCREGIDFDAVDGRPVHIFVLIATPADSHDLHLKVLASVAKIFGRHPHIREKILAAVTPGDVFEVLHDEEVEHLNPFFED